MDGKTTLKYIVIGIAGWFTFKGARFIFGVVICLCVIALPFQLLYSACATTAEKLNVVKIWSMQQEINKDKDTPGTLAYYAKVNEEAEAKRAAETEDEKSKRLAEVEAKLRAESERWKTWALTTMPKINPDSFSYDWCKDAIETNGSIDLWCKILHDDVKKWARLDLN